MRLLWAGVFTVLLVVVVGGPASGATGESPTPAPAGVHQASATLDLVTVVGNATGWLVTIMTALATFFLTLGGIRYLSASDDPSEVERAKGSLKNALIGYALALLAPTILYILQHTILGVN